MSLAQLFFSEKNEIGTIEFDVVISESASASAIVTKNPVERGADVTDNIIIEPMKFSLSGIVSDTPVKLLGGLKKGGILTGNEQSRTAWDELLKLQASKQPFTLVQNLKSYDNIVIESLSTSQDSSTSKALTFTANMTEIIFAGVEEIDGLQFDTQAVADANVPKKNLGQKDA